MILFKEVTIKQTVNKLLKGEDYRDAVLNEINLAFLEFTLEFFKEIVNSKFENKNINSDWYKDYFITNKKLSPVDVVINAGLNKKTVTNIYGSSKKEIMINAAESNYEYLYKILKELENDIDNNILISIKISYNSINVELTLAESLIVINTLATKKIALRGGAWSSIGKRVEKPLLDELCKLAGVPDTNKDNSIFKKDTSKDFDREVDYILIDSVGSKYRVEVKLMGKGNPESADVIIARDTNILIADTLSEQNKNQLISRNVKYLELKDNDNIINDFKIILQELKIPFKKN